MSLESPETSWKAKVEAALRSIPSVESARIKVENGRITEVHVVTGSNRPPKLTARDVQTMLNAEFATEIDYRIVSVVARRSGEPSVTDGLLTERATVPHEAPAPAARASDPRIRFGNVNLSVSGHRAHAQVELRWKGITRMGSASGWGTRESGHLLIAQATLAAVHDYLDADMALSVKGLEVVRVAGQEVVLVALSLLAHRNQKPLVGSCTVEQDAQQAVVLATLAALNRVVGGLRTKEPTEYVLRPASA